MNQPSMLKIVPNGETRVRILPTRTFMREDGEQVTIPWLTTHRHHWDVIARKNVACPGDGCPFCRYYRQDPVAHRNNKPIVKFLCNAIDRAHPRPKVQVLNVCMTIGNAIANAGEVEAADPQLGKDLIIVHEMRGPWACYDRSRWQEEPSPLTTDDETMRRLLSRSYDIRRYIPHSSSPIMPRAATTVRHIHVPLPAREQPLERQPRYWQLPLKEKKFSKPKVFDFNGMREIYRHGL